MQWWEIGLIVLASLGIFLVIYYAISVVRYKKIIDKTSSLISNVFSNPQIQTFKNEDLVQMTFKDKKQYSIKLIDMNIKHEIIITNSDRVIVNENIKGWKRSTKPNFVPGMREYFNNNNSGNHIKIVLIYPGCHNIIKYINESDVYIVEKYQKVDNVYFIKFPDLEEFLKKQ